MAKLHVHGTILFIAIKEGSFISVLGSKIEFRTTDNVMSDGRVLTKTQYLREGKYSQEGNKIKLDRNGTRIKLNTKDIPALKLWYTAFGYRVL